MDTTAILTRILTIIDYQDDRQQFIDQFSSQCVRLTIINSIDSLPKEKKEELLKKINPKQGVVKVRVVLQEYISEVLYQKLLEKTAQKQFEEYIETILPKLSAIQKTTLLEFLSKIGKEI